MLSVAWAAGPSVLVVYDDGAGSADVAMARACFVHATAALRAVDVPFAEAKLSGIERWGFGAARAAVFPYAPSLSPAAAQRLSAWLAAGGRGAIFAGPLSRAAAEALGVSPAERRRAGYPGQFQRLVFPAPEIPGLPNDVPVRAAAVFVLHSTAARGCGAVRSAAGTVSAQPAVLVGSRWAHICAPLAGAPLVPAGQLLRALVAHFDASLWRQIVPAAPAQLGPVEDCPSLASLISQLQHRRGEGPHVAAGLARAQEAAAALVQANRQLAAGKVNEACDAARTAKHLAWQAFWIAWPSREQELRGVWARNDADIDWADAARRLAHANFQVVFPYFASGAASFYKSSVLPAAAHCQKDWLAEALAACHAAGLKLHARILGLSCLFAAHGALADLQKQGRLMTTRGGRTLRWLCPTDKRNRDALIAAAEEIVSKYPVDGLQLDYFRYPGSACCLCSRCRRAFEAYIGRKVARWPEDVLEGDLKARLFEFRRHLLTGLLGEIRSAVQRARPGLPVSAAVFINWPRHRDSFGQDWVNWLREGLLDFACPMDYTDSESKFAEWVRLQVGWAGGQRLCIGIGLFADNVPHMPRTVLARQIQIARASAAGFVIFNLQRRLLDDYLPALSLGITSKPARMPSFAAAR